MDISSCGFLILAGGKSRRMGRSKAELPIGGTTFLKYLIDKGRSLGFAQILVSGYGQDGVTPNGKCAAHPISDHTQLTYVEDVLRDRGPLGGLYSSFLQCRCLACFVISVDVPLMDENTIRRLVHAHGEGQRQATLLEHHGKTEPLIGVYSVGEIQMLRQIIEKQSAAVFCYLDNIGYRTVPLLESEDSIYNFNTLQDFHKLETLMEAKVGREGQQKENSENTKRGQMGDE